MLLVSLGTVFPFSAPAQESRPAARAVLRAGTLSFTGHATVGDFVGSTRTVSGMVEGDLTGARGWVMAPVATLATRNEHRDRDMRASMEVEKYPTMRFDLARVSVVGAGGSATEPVAVLLHGTLRIHGVSRGVVLPAQVSLDGDSTRVTSEFPLDLVEYRIGGLTKMFGMLRMDRHIEVRFDLWFVSEPAADVQAGER